MATPSDRHQEEAEGQVPVVEEPQLGLGHLEQ
jgi:hypothetical protein